MDLEVGTIAPDFCLPDENGNTVCLKDFRGKWVVLYFYPKDNTPGCTKEAQDFSEKLEEFEKVGAVVLGVSPDSVESHRKFKEKKRIRVKLLSDTEKEVIKRYNVWQLKKMYGKEYYGVVRTTYLIDPEGRIAHVWKRVKVKGHADSVLKKIQEFSGGKK
ncbi:thioredoxin-dependent thiol peroxidase [Phorcysia thermohydrogeniphila]|uniref:thioredoxin-dependent peroxiredoxin n=1 Tax=Phorcysia thermohydrogeniphila TaxID=936138 RepID=A0A4R1GEB1_9BACT|nr:thioredoxin-dependent thiol peroxidase [Phorcysia thermohydrogeniphila]TCK06534.1 peroxiredoxin Q/BCP [Phorcysia thermohydrogeniphila]